MTMKLYSEESVQAIADAIRSINGETGTMTIGEMAGKIAAIGGTEYREVWLQANPGQGIFVDTGVAGDYEHTIEVTGFGNIYGSSTIFGAVTNTSSRQVIDLLTTTNKFRVAWANSGLKTYTYEISQWSAWLPMIVQVSKDGWSIHGFNQSRNPVTLSDTFGDTGNASASTESYKVFPNVSTTGGGQTPGWFRNAKIYNSNGANLLHDFVPIMYGDFSLALLDKVTDAEIAIPSGANGFSGFWSPKHDSLVGLT